MENKKLIIANPERYDARTESGTCAFIQRIVTPLVQNLRKFSQSFSRNMIRKTKSRMPEQHIIAFASNAEIITLPATAPITKQPIIP